MATNRLTPLSFTSAAGADVSAFNRFLRHFDWFLFLDVLLLCGIGMVMVYSASLRFGHPGVFFGKQFTAFVIGMLLLFILATVNYQVFSQYPKILFVFSTSLLILVLVVGTSSRGARAWFTFGPLAFQPSEVAKLVTILLLAIWCDKHSREMHHLKNLAVPFLIVASQVALILLQPDFGSTLVYLPVLLGMLFVAGASFLQLFVVLLYAAVAGSILLLHTFLSLSPMFLEAHPLWDYIYRGLRIGKEFAVLQISFGVLAAGAWWFCKQLRFRIPGFYFASVFVLILAGWSSSSMFINSLKEYQRKRLNVFFSPSLDPMGAGYHVIQSKVAIGSGKIFGKGLFSGTQSRLGFLPEQHTDFIFSVLGEEMGFSLSAFVLLLYIFLLWRAIAIAGDARDNFGSMVAVGIACMFAFYTFMNLAMVMGMAPVAGLPLPFLSYGGSALVSSLAAVGFLLSIHVRRYTH